MSIFCKIILKMAKRNACSSTWRNLSTKKSKVDELGDIWEDDLDEDAIDDCFRKATQESATDVSLLSSYSVFKQPKHILTSTQYSQPPVENKGSIEDHINELEKKYAQKEGETSILRSNLENLRTSCQIDQERKDVEWKEKLSAIEKENKTIKSDLEFKSLEIVNLKQQIAELSKLVNVEQNITQKLQTTDNKILPGSPDKNINSSCGGNTRVYVNLEKYYPLKSFDFLFTHNEFYNTSQNVKYTKNLDKQKKAFGDDITVESIMNYFCEEALSLINLSSEDFSSDQSKHSISQVVWFSYQLLEVFQDSLGELEKPLHETREADVQYLHTDRLRQISLLCSEVLRFLQEILPFSTFLKKCLFVELPAYLNRTETTRTNVYGVVESHYLTLLSHVIAIIGKTKQESYYKAFLSTVIKLIGRIFSSEDLTDLNHNTQVNILNQLLVLNLDFQLIQEMNVLLNVVSCSDSFTYMLFSDHEKLKNNCNKECSRFLAYISLLEDTLLTIKSESEFSSFTSRILNLTHSILKIDKTCECVCKLYKLSIGIIYRNIKAHQASPREAVFLPKCYIEILSLIIFNAYDLTQKYIIDYAQIKEIMYTMTSINGEINNMNLKILDKLSATEDFPVIGREKFNLVDL